MTSGFSSDDNTVVAKLDIEVPTDGVGNLVQIQKTTEQLASATESVARSQEDYNNYLRELPQLLRESTVNAPPRPSVSEGEAEQQLQQLRERDPQQYRNFLVQRGEEISGSSLGTGNRTSTQGSGFREEFVSNVAGEMSAEATSSGFGDSLAQGVVQGVAAEKAAGLVGQSLGMGRTSSAAGSLASQITSGFTGGVAGGAASGLGMGSLGALARGGLPGLLAAGTIGGGVVAYNKLQDAAETYQDYKNLGMTRGGGAQEGLNFEFQTRMMALNPFINTEQSRQIINSALSEGYTGKEFDTITEFMSPQPLSESVLTPYGWVTMGDLEAGDEVIGSDGRPKMVLGKELKGVKEIYEVVFIDGTRARSSIDHLWGVYINGGNYQVRSLESLVEKLYNSQGQPNWSVPLVQPVEFTPEELPLDPYLLGLLLGDGHLGKKDKSGSYGTIGITSYEDEEYHFQLPEGVEKRWRESDHCYELACVRGLKSKLGRPKHPVRVILEELGLSQRSTLEKFIPEKYLWGRAEDRIALLQGLIDTDGGVYTAGTCQFFNTNEGLVDQVEVLARSLGAVTSRSVSPPVTTTLKDGSTIEGKYPIHTLSIRRLPDGVVPARLARKVEKFKGGNRLKHQKKIVEINLVGREETACILVDSEDHLYVTRDFTLTHNTNLKEMNLSAAESMTLFQKNVKSGGASVGELNTQLETLKTLSQEGAKTLQDRQAGFTAVSSSLVDSGLGGVEAGQTAVLTGEMFSDDQDLKSVFDDLVATGSGNPRVLSQLGQAAGLGPINPYEVEQSLADRGPTGIPDAYWQLIRRIANTSVVKNNWDQGNRMAAANYFKNMLQSRLGMNLTVNQAMKLLERAYSPNSVNEVFESQSRIDEAQYGVEEDWSLGDAAGDLLGSAGSALDVLGHAVTDTLGGISNLFSGDGDRIKNSYSATADAARKAQRKDQVNYQRYRVQRFDDLVSEFGVGAIEMQDAEGNEIDSSKWGQDKQVMEDLASGKNKVRVNGGEWTTLRDSWGASTESSTGGEGGKYVFDLTPRAAELLRPTDRRTQNQSQADSGYSDATRNRVPPGDR